MQNMLENIFFLFINRTETMGTFRSNGRYTQYLNWRVLSIIRADPEFSTETERERETFDLSSLWQCGGCDHKAMFQQGLFYSSVSGQ